MFVMPSGGFTPYSIFWYRLANKTKPTQLLRLWVGSALLEDVYSDSLTHTLAGLQQQHIEVVLGVIVIASNLLYRC